MSAERLAALEHRLAVLERRRRALLVIGGAGVVALAIASLMPAAQAQSTSQVRAPFSVVNSAGQEIFAVTQVGSDTRVTILHRGTVQTTWSADEDGALLALGGPNMKGVARLAVNFSGADTGPSLLMAAGTRNVMSVENDSAEISAPLTVLPKDDVPALRVEPDLVTVTSGLTIRASKGANRTSLGPTRLSIHGADGASIAASLGLDDAQRGMLRVGNPAGLRAAIGFTKSGQSMSVGIFDKPGPDARVSLFGGADGSSLQLKSPSGEVELNTDGTGGLIALSSAKGSAAVALEMKASGAGEFTIGDAAGNTVVEAGVTTDGLGVVRAGPDLGGTTGAMSGGLVVPRAILGRRAK
jgi:hypothetical protein